MADGRPNSIVLLALVLSLAAHSHGAQQYLGKFLGKLSELHHGVSGEVYAVDARTLHLKDFTYDGEGPAAYFWAGSSRTPGSSGFRVRDENGSGAVLKRYRKKSVTITLPDGKNLNNIKWFSVWCDEFAVNFGDVKIPRNFDYPKPQKIEPMRGVHGISSDNIVIVDAQTLLVPNLSYDGEAPDAKFWVGRGSKPSPQGIRVPDENGKEVPLRKYDRKTVVLTLPGDLTVFDIGHFGIWCEAFTVDFGHVRVPQSLNVPPSLKMLGVSPQSKLNCEVLYDELAFEVRWAVAGDSIVLQLVSKLDDGEYMSFGLSGDDSKTQMIGGDVAVAWVDRATLKGFADDYFLEAKSQCSGPSGSCPDERLAEKTNSIRLLNAAMVNGYSIVTYQRPLKASDEFDRRILTNQSQAIIWAIGPLNERNEVSFHSHYTKKDHFIDFGRPAKWNCPVPESDGTTSPNTERTTAPVQQTPAPVQQTPAPVQRRKPEVVQPDEEPSYPVEVTTRGRVNERRRGGNRDTIERRRDGVSQSRERVTSRQEERPTRRRGVTDRHTDRTTTAVTTERARTVPTPKPVTNRNAWNIPPIQCDEPDDGVLYAQMGPTGGKHGYPAITGHVGWGISWYINGLLIPEINVVRGKTYTFVVEGGLDPEVPAKYHPFYITDDSVGGYEHKTPEEKANIRIFAGAKQTRDGKVYPTGVGRLCHWTHTGDREADDFQSFGAFQRTLELRCDTGEPGVITWTPDADTPDTVYYQCFTHRYLGWKINVVDSCDARAEGSDPEPAWMLPDMLADNDDTN
ncbi:skeletor [Carabus blaptoides fortunei]